MMATSNVERARDITELVREHADTAEQQKHLSKAVAQAFAKNGLYRLGAPISLSGQDLEPRHQMEVIEVISEADGSAGWNLMIGIETFALVAPSMSTCAECVADPEIIMSSSTANVGTADPVEGGWLINGQWRFVSGIHNAHVFGATVRKTNEEKVDPPQLYYAVLQPKQYEILDTWNVAGLRGSGSHDVRVINELVENPRIVATLGHGTLPSRQLTLPLGLRLTVNKVAVALGIARAAIESFKDLAHGKRPRFSNRKLKDRPFAQRKLAEAEVRFRLIRSAIYEHTDLVTEKAFKNEPLTDQDIAIAHLLAMEASTGCAQVVDTLLEAAGTSANVIGHPLERISRDIRVIRQHTTVAPQHQDDAAYALMGNGLRGFLSI